MLTVVFALTAFSVALSPLSPAAAFPNDVDAGCHYYRNFEEISFAGTWPVAARNAVRTGMFQWNGALNFRGVPLTAVAEPIPPRAPTELTFQDLGPAVLGRANCVFNYIQISSRGEYQSTALQTAVARHELGHILAKPHTGQFDSFNSDNPPTMATCLFVAEFESATNKSQDDVGALNFSHSRLGGTSDSPMMANMGLEQGFSYFGTVGATVDYLTSDGATGPGHIRFTPGNPSTDYVYQTMSWSDAPSKRVEAVINHKTNALTDDGSVTVELWARSVTYGTTSSCGVSQWPNGKNMNERTSGTFVRQRASTTGESPVWLLQKTDFWVSLAGGEQDVQLRVFANMRTGSGAPTSTRLDNLRTQCFASQSEGDCI